MNHQEIKDRIDAVNVRATRLSVQLHKAAQRRMGPRIPGDGDGDGIPNEGKNKGKKLPKGAIGQAKVNDAKQPVYNGKVLSATGKTGTNIATGQSVKEHAVIDREGRKTGERYWLNSSNHVFPD